MSECEHLERTSAYFDGALAPADEAEALAHLGQCAACQQLLGDAVAIDALLSTRAAAEPLSQAPPIRREPRAASASAEPRGRGRWIVAGVVALAAAVALWLGVRRPPAETPSVVAIELASERAVEARFTGAQFARHRPLRVLRGDVAREAIPLQTMAELERRGEHAELVAALVASGDLVRARELAAKLPESAQRESDRAAIALASGDPELALAHVYHALDRDPELVAAHWNFALAARSLGLWRVARAALERVIAAGEPGWADEARAQLAVVERELAGDAAYPDIDRRGREMIAGGPPLTAADVDLAEAQVRIHFYDAVRLAGDAARIDALRPLATALDAKSGTAHATAALDRAEPALAARFGARYRTLIEQRSQAPDVPALLAELRAAGPKAHFLRAGAIILADQATARWKELRDLVSPWRDPWFDLLVEHERIRATWPGNDLRAEQPLVTALAGCTNPAWALRCAGMANDLAQLLFATGREALAATRGAEAVELYRRAGFPRLRTHARALVAEIHRRRGRTARARAEFDEIVLASIDQKACDLERYARIGHAGIAIVDGDWAAARRALPAATPPEGCAPDPDVLGLAAAADLARQTGAPEDVAAARQWIERTREPAGGGFAIVADARIARGEDPEKTRALADWLARTPESDDPYIAAARTWGTTTLIADAGARGDWAEVIAVAVTSPRLANVPCVFVASSDDEALTLAVRAKGVASGVHRKIPVRDLATTELASPELASALSGCPEIAVVARPPLHGRADLLPPSLPWWFAGDVAATAIPRPSSPAPQRSLEVVDARPPDPSLPRLAPIPSAAKFDVSIAGDAATPSRVLAALADATYAELHVHGVAAAYNDDAAYLALSPDPTGAFALRAGAVRAAKLRKAPLVVLAACRAAEVAPYLRQRWSLPDAFLAAGASAVVASDVAIPDADARRIFDELHRRIAAGESVTAAVAALRASAGPDATWMRRLMVFR